MKKLIGIICILSVCVIAASYFSDYIDPVYKNGFDDKSCTDYYYLTLDETEKEAYEAVRNSIYSFPKRIKTPALSDEQLSNVLCAVLYDDPMLFMFDSCTLETSGNKAYFIPDYQMTEDEYYEYKNRIDLEVEKIASTSPETEYEKALYCHDYVVNNCTYTDTDAYYEDNTMGVFLENKAQCGGYAEAFKVLLDRVGIECVLIVGKATDSEQKTDSHMWTAVKIDGSWCYTDPTWDDPISTSGEDVCRYVYFNMTEEILRLTHSDFEFREECNSPSLYYYIRYNAYFESCEEDTHSQISKLISDAADNGQESVTIVFASKKAKEQAVDCLIERQNIYRILETASLASEISLVTDSVRYLVGENENSLTIYVEAKE